MRLRCRGGVCTPAGGEGVSSELTSRIVENLDVNAAAGGITDGGRLGEVGIGGVKELERLFFFFLITRDFGGDLEAIDSSDVSKRRESEKAIAC